MLPSHFHVPFSIFVCVPLSLSTNIKLWNNPFTRFFLICMWKTKCRNSVNWTVAQHCIPNKEVSISYGNKGNEVGPFAVPGSLNKLSGPVPVKDFVFVCLIILYNDLGFRVVDMCICKLSHLGLCLSDVPSCCMQELLYLYGFVIENNPDDFLMVIFASTFKSSVLFNQ